MGQQVGVQLIGIVATVAYTAVLTFVLLKLVGVITPLRADTAMENEGLDLTDHDERGYNL